MAQEWPLGVTTWERLFSCLDLLGSPYGSFSRSGIVKHSPVVSGGLWWSQYIISVFVPTYLLLLILYREFSHWGTHTPFQKVVPENVQKLGN